MTEKKYTKEEIEKAEYDLTGGKGFRTFDNPDGVSFGETLANSMKDESSEKPKVSLRNEEKILKIDLDEWLSLRMLIEAEIEEIKRRKEITGIAPYIDILEALLKKLEVSE